jgi:hypothetical protein
MGGLKLEPLVKVINTLEGHIEDFFLIGLNDNNYEAYGTKIVPKLLYVDNLFTNKFELGVCLNLLCLFSCASKIL